jgi:hypothetical protein
MKKYQWLITTSAALCSFGLLSANWVLIENFEDQNTDRWEGDSQLLQAGIHTEFQGSYEIVQDPIGGNNSWVGQFSGGPEEGDNFGLPGAVAHSIFLPEPITRDQTATFYFQLGVATWESDNAFGLTHVPSWNQFWGDMETVMRYEFNNATFDVYNQSRFETFGFPEMNLWYHVWKVVNAANNTYEIYMQGGLDYPEQTRVMTFDGNETFFMRNRASDPIVRFAIIHNINSIEVSFPREPMYIDNLYIDYSGVNLEIPEGGEIVAPETWAGLNINASGFVDSGSYLGPIYVNAADWAYIQNTSKWVYLPEANFNSTVGSWIYVPAFEADFIPVGNSAYQDTGAWLGLLFNTNTGWYYSFEMQTWVMIPEADNGGAWMFVPAS